LTRTHAHTPRVTEREIAGEKERRREKERERKRSPTKRIDAHAGPGGLGVGRDEVALALCTQLSGAFCQLSAAFCQLSGADRRPFSAAQKGVGPSSAARKGVGGGGQAGWVGVGS
jgi:hypothetical protein